jgi:D-ribose pyranose/furanose isomerase RbsD
VNRNRLLDAQLSHAIASMGHGDLMILCGAFDPWGDILLYCGVDGPAWFSKEGVVAPDYHARKMKS